MVTKKSQTVEASQQHESLTPHSRNKRVAIKQQNQHKRLGELYEFMLPTEQKEVAIPQQSNLGLRKSKKELPLP